MRRWLLILFLCCSSIAFGADTLLQFSLEEQAFIERHPVIRMGIDPSFVPFEFLDSEGRHQGVSSDIVAHIERETGLQFLLMEGLSWQEVTNKAQRRELDVLPAVGRTQDRERYLLFSQPYVTFQRSIVVKNTNEGIRRFEDLFGRQVAVQANSSHHGLLEEYPQILVRTYDTVLDALLAVNRGDEIAFIGNDATTSYLASANGMTGLSFIPIETGSSQQLHLAVRNDWPELISIINKALGTLDESELAEIYNQWIRVDQRIDYGPLIRIVVGLGILFSIILGVSAYWIIRLRHEIAQKEEAQRTTELAKRRVEDNDREKSRFMARMSHEIRTPLNGINGMTYLLEQTHLDATQKRYLATISQATRNMLAIINDIIEYSRIEERSVTLEELPFKLDEVVHHVVSLESQVIAMKQLKVQLEWEDDVPVHVVGDANRVGQILTNLIHNAVKFTELGTIGIRISCAELAGMVCRVRFEVSDTGIGMTEEVQRQLFKPFSQADASIARRYGGSGLGLSIVKSLVEAMHGSVSVSSVERQGSVFTIELPFNLDRSGAEEDAQRLADSNISSMSILVLARNEEIRKAVEVILRRIGASGDYIGSSRLALQLLDFKDTRNGQQYQLLFIDSTVDSGVGALLESIQRGTEIASRPKIVVFVEQNDASGGEALRAAGADLVLPKPVLPSLVFNSLLELLSVDMIPDYATEKRCDSASQTESPTILVVEDNAVNRTVAQQVLEKSGFTVILAENGSEGVDRFVEQRDTVSLILMDLHMDVMDGFEATKRIREIDGRLPIFALTADVVGDIRKRCTDHGFTLLVAKPFDPPELIRLIRETLGVHSESPARPLGQSVRGDSAAPKVFDTVAGLRRVDGDVSLYRKIVRLFSKEMVDDGEQLKVHLLHRDWKQVADTAHKVKGSASTIGAQRLEAEAKGLQQAMKSPETLREDRVDAFFRELSAVQEEISHFLDLPEGHQ